jgi:hypothetical protein
MATTEPEYVHMSMSDEKQTAMRREFLKVRAAHPGKIIFWQRGDFFETFDDDDSFVAECRRYLLDQPAAAQAGSRLYDINRQRWEQRRPHRAVEALLRAEAVAA